MPAPLTRSGGGAPCGGMKPSPDFYAERPVRIPIDSYSGDAKRLAPPARRRETEPSPAGFCAKKMEPERAVGRGCAHWTFGRLCGGAHEKINTEAERRCVHEKSRRRLVQTAPGRSPTVRGCRHFRLTQPDPKKASPAPGPGPLSPVSGKFEGEVNVTAVHPHS